MRIAGYNHFGGKHSESAALKNLLAFAGVNNPQTGKPLSEALCFGIAGGIGAGYSFCPSVPRSGMGSGVAIVGRYKVYATDATWYQGFCERIGAKTRITETGGTGKAYQNLAAELEAGRPTVVWCAQPKLPFLGMPTYSCGLWMHTFIVYGVDQAAGLAYGADCSFSKVTITLDQLAEARKGVCSHKNRTLTIEPHKALTPAVLKAAVQDGLGACVKEMLQPRMKTFSLAGLETLAKMICNDSNKDGWRKVFRDGFLYCALRDAFDSIETANTGGSLYRFLFAEFLDEASAILLRPGLADLAQEYRALGKQWSELADALLPSKIKPFRQTKELLIKKRHVYEEKGEKGHRTMTDALEKLRKLEVETRRAFPLGSGESLELLEGIRQRIVALHQAESRAAEQMKRAIS